MGFDVCAFHCSRLLTRARPLAVSCDDCGAMRGGGPRPGTAASVIRNQGIQQWDVADVGFEASSNNSTKQQRPKARRSKGENASGGTQEELSGFDGSGAHVHAPCWAASQEDVVRCGGAMRWARHAM